jgi:hypothetical protein
MIRHTTWFIWLTLALCSTPFELLLCAQQPDSRARKDLRPSLPGSHGTVFVPWILHGA